MPSRQWFAIVTSLAIPDARIDDLISMWERAFSERLTRDQARAVADRVLYLYRRLLQHHRPCFDDEKTGEQTKLLRRQRNILGLRSLGRFIQTDPIGYGDGPNWYSYVHNSPINSTDPSGTDPEDGDELDNGDAGGFNDPEKLPGGILYLIRADTVFVARAMAI